MLPGLAEVGFGLELVTGRENGLCVRAGPAIFADRMSVDALLGLVD